MQRIWATIKSPTAMDPVGAIAEGFYDVTDGHVRLLDRDGNPLGRPVELEEGQDAQAVARRLLRERARTRTAAASFRRQVNYPNAGIV